MSPPPKKLLVECSSLADTALSSILFSRNRACKISEMANTHLSDVFRTWIGMFQEKKAAPVSRDGLFVQLMAAA
jgi:hypothetical protein